ncbi:dnaJ homolog subfamily C member 1-like [Apostichopus japonicus]|uniref:dnaJ homolog subfamily C member 1-like n=1 Tax=Stichopus japonicus TaxID=307972 RepID=UPI003AB2929A
MAVLMESRRQVSTGCSHLFRNRLGLLCLLLISLLQFQRTHAWDNTDFELFDLVEEVPQNFYELLGLDQSATQTDIRRAYRRLSLQYHPDKNKEEGAEETFRKLVAVAEVLRDEDTRKRYDDILIHGLPDWRQPVFYYRRVRKMGLLEAGTLLSIILTVGHYIVMWSMYWERKFELESLIKPKKEKRNKKVSKLSDDPKPDAYAMLEDQSFLPKPQITDSLPFKCYRLSKASVFLLVVLVKNLLGTVKEKMEEKPEEELVPSSESEEEEEADRKPRVRQKFNPALYEYDRNVSLDHLDALKVVPEEIRNRQESSAPKENKNDIWTQEEVKLLIKSIAKYPGGTTDRWDKIAAEVDRPVNVVTRKAKEIKTKGYATAVDASIQGITGGVSHTVVNKQTGEGDTDCISIASTPLEDQPITSQVASYDYFEEEEDESTNKKRKRKNKSSRNLPRTEMIVSNHKEEEEIDASQDKNIKNVETLGGKAGKSKTTMEPVEELVFDGVESCSWTQRQQKVLEKALQVYPKGTPERWDKIASSVPGKKKEECIVRYKELVEIVRRKKQASEK